jgi:hypothetical protein
LISSTSRKQEEESGKRKRYVKYDINQEDIVLDGWENQDYNKYREWLTR